MLTFFRQLRKGFLESGQARKYTLYATGEIALVVIGILMALQINNWNDSRINQNRVRNNISGLLIDLRKDSTTLLKSLVRIQEDMDVIESFKNRLNSSEATLDTLKQIARYEFSPVVSTNQLGNNNLYNTLVMSGEINLFERKIIEEINAYYSYYDEVKISERDHWNLYLNTIRQYIEQFTHNRSLINDGPLNDAIWDAAEANVLASKFNAWAATKRLYYVQRSSKFRNLTKKNVKLITLLQELQNDIE